MGYSFKSDNQEDFYIRNVDASAVRGAAPHYLLRFLPDPETEGCVISPEEQAELEEAFREQGQILLKLADYLSNAKGLRWSH